MSREPRPEVVGMVTLGVALGIVGAVDACRSSEAEIADEAVAAERVLVDRKTLRFDDADSFYANGLQIRVLGIDAPEIAHPEHGIDIDQPGGRAAAAFARRRLEEADRIELLLGGEDAYGRTLAHALLDGELLSVLLVRAGHAYETVSIFGTDGFREQADAILEAAEKAPKPKFQRPWHWRRKHQKRR